MKELVAQLREIASQLEELAEALKPHENCYPVYKWVYNKIKKKYWYWYLHCYDSNGMHSIYLGSSSGGITLDHAANKSLNQIAKRVRKAVSLLRAAIATLELASQDLEMLRGLLDIASERRKKLEEELQKADKTDTKKREKIEHDLEKLRSLEQLHSVVKKLTAKST